MKQACVILLLLMFICGCSTKFGYFFLDWVIEWKVEEYVTLDYRQEQAFEQLLDRVIDWHQSRELGRYARQLRQLSRQLDQGVLTGRLWADHVSRAKAHWFRLLEHTLDQLLPLIASLSDAQVRQIMNNLTRNEKILVTGYAGKSRQLLIQEADNRLQRQLKAWSGGVGHKQAQLIHDYNSQRLATLDMWLEYRHEWLRQFGIALTQRHDKPLLKKRLSLLLLRPDELKPAIYRKKLLHNTEKFGDMLLKIYRDFTPRQKRYFRNELNDLISDLEDLNRMGQARVGKR